MTNMKAPLIALLAGTTLAITLNYATGSNRIDGDTGNKTPQCPQSTHLVSFEDGSGSCYTDGSDESWPVYDDKGQMLRWDEDTFSWNCFTMGNKTCGDLPHWDDYDGHDDCVAAIGDTTYVMCPDGFTTKT